MRRTRTALIGLALLAAIGAPAATARADGLPATGIDVGASGVATPGSPFRYVALRDGDMTLVARTAQQGGQVMLSRRIPGRFTIPAVAYDRSAGGLSADGETLVLIQPRPGFPRRQTGLALIDTPRLRARVVTLRGDFSFDAISPDGRWAYLVHYLSPRNPTDYEVRAYDVTNRRLVPGPIVDPEEPDERMGGIPISRASSPDGRWAYTLYDGKEPFVHALDTAGRTAVCVDLPQLTGHSLTAMRLRTEGGGTRLVVTDKATPRLLIDTASFSVSGVAAGSGGDGGGSPFAWLLALALFSAAILGLGLRHTLGRRPGRTPPGVATGTSD
jgi:hypothetical protein